LYPFSCDLATGKCALFVLPPKQKVIRLNSVTPACLLLEKKKGL
jgi:hypothetical protein